MNEEEPTTTESSPPEKKRNPLISGVVVCAGVVSAVWLFIPEPSDLIPLAGWIDEAAAIGILVACASYFGFDIKGILSKFGKDVPDTEKKAQGKVIESEDR